MHAAASTSNHSLSLHDESNRFSIPEANESSTNSSATIRRVESLPLSRLQALSLNFAEMTVYRGSQILRALCCGERRSRSLKAPTQTEAFEVAQEVLMFMDEIRQANVDTLPATFHRLVDRLNAKQLGHLNYFLHHVVKHHGDLDDLLLDHDVPDIVRSTYDQYLKPILQSSVDSRAIKLLVNLTSVLSLSNQQWILKNIPRSVVLMAMLPVKGALLDRKRPMVMTADIAASLKSVAPVNPKSDELSDSDIHRLGGQLWGLTADYLEASRLKEPAANWKDMAATEIVDVPESTRAQRMREAMVKHAGLFSVIMQQENLEATFEKLFHSAELPPSVAKTIEVSASKFIQQLMPEWLLEVRDRFSNLLGSGVDLVPDDKLATLLRSVPDDMLLELSDDLNTLFKNLRPYDDLPFYREFVSSLVASIVGPAKKIAVRLTHEYFPAMKDHPEFQREMTLPLLRLGRDASRKERLEALAQSGGILFQKSMQGLSDSITDPEIREVMGNLKDQVEPMPGSKALKILEDQLAGLKNEFSANSKTIEIKNVSPEAIHAATIAQVHQGILSITTHAIETHVAGESEPRMIAASTVEVPVALKIKRDQVERKFSIEREGILKALSQPSKLEQEEEAKLVEEGDQAAVVAMALERKAVTRSVAALIGTIEKELDFNREVRNSQMTEQLFHSDDGPYRIRAAKTLANTPSLIIQEWAEGHSVDTGWKKLEAEAEPTLNSFLTRIAYLKHTGKLLKMNVHVWIRAFLLGKPQVGRLLDSDIHDGNSKVHLSHEGYTYTAFDPGGADTVDDGEVKMMVKLIGAMYAGNTKAIYDALQPFVDGLPASPRDSQVLEGFKPLTKLPELEERIEDTDVFLKRIGVLKPEEDWHALVKHYSESHKQLARAHGQRASGKDRLRLRSRLRDNSTRALLNVLESSGHTVNETQKQSIRQFTHNSKNRMVSFDRPAHLITDQFNEVFFVKTLLKLVQVLAKQGYPVPEILLLTSRGAKMASDRLIKNNERKEALGKAIHVAGMGGQLRSELKTMKSVDVGNVFMGALKEMVPSVVKSATLAMVKKPFQ